MITIDRVAHWKPCLGYDQKRIAQLFAKRRALSPQEVAALNIPARDRLWALMREEVLPAIVLYNLGVDFAERALVRERQMNREPDTRSWTAINTKRKWLRGEVTDSEMNMVHNAAEKAAQAAGQLAGWSMGGAAARSAAAWSAADAAIIFEEYIIKGPPRCASGYAAWGASRGASAAAARAVCYEIGTIDWCAVKDAWRTEHEWQIKRLLEAIT